MGGLLLSLAEGVEEADFSLGGGLSPALGHCLPPTGTPPGHKDGGASWRHTCRAQAGLASHCPPDTIPGLNGSGLPRTQG